MLEFLATVLSFPTVVFAAVLAIVLLYWCVVIFGALDLDFLDGLLGLDQLDSALDSALEGALEGDVAEISDLEGAAGAKSGVLSGLLTSMGVRGVPVTIVGSAVVLWAFVLSFAGTKLLGPLGGSLLTGVFIAAAASMSSLAIGAVTVRPFRSLFVTQTGTRRASLVGKLCTVTSARVDGKSGRAEIEDGGSGFVAEVRCPQENDLARGSRALVYRYEPVDGVFYVGPVDEVLTAAEAVREHAEEEA